jgi:hypothetical protein
MLRSYYREIIWARWWFWISFLGAIAVPSCFLIVQSFFELPAWWHPAPTSALLILIAALALIFPAFGRLSIKVDSESIKVGYGVIRKTISLDEVVSCEPTSARLRVYGGVGIRLGTDGSLAFTTSRGNAVKITSRKGRPFVLSSNNPERLSKIIEKISKARSL